jgi:alkylation response protein AidB-like acyl-CoA dehydrogenase
MATGEVVLDGAEAELVGPIDRGFKAMTEMLNLSRLYNAVASVAVARRAALEATRYLRQRRTFGAPALTHPLLRETLADLHAEQIAATHLTFQTAAHLDRADAGSSLDLQRVRLLTPLAKLTTAKLAVWAASEAIELIGGNGYIEDFVTARLLRDAQVLPVWEGTTNVLLLDLLRACAKERGHEPVLEDIQARCEAAPADLKHEAEVVTRLTAELADESRSLLVAEPSRQAQVVRRFAERLALAFTLSLLFEAGNPLASATARRLSRRHLEPQRDPSSADTAALVDGAVLET